MLPLSRIHLALALLVATPLCNASEQGAGSKVNFAREVLPILVEHLNATNRGTRNDANEMLKRLTGQDFKFSPWRYPLAGKQIEALECWRAYVDEYLGEKK